MSKIMVLTVGGVDYRLALGNIPLGEKEAVLQQTRRSLEQWTAEEAQGELTIAVLWWLARRAEGERRLTWAEARDQWPEDLTGINVEVVEDSGTSDHPE